MAEDALTRQLQQLDSAALDYTSRLVDAVLAHAVQRSASDVHFEPTHREFEVRFRIDGVLQNVAALRRELSANVVARLKVMAELLTYRVDVPQEGRMIEASKRHGVDMRVSTFPIIHGEKAAVRIFDSATHTLDLEQLGIPGEVLDELSQVLRERSGAVFLTGPSGSGKTTTIYACLRHLVRQSGGGRHIVTIEDPVEQVIEGISQAQVRPGSEFDFARGLRSILRQDPDVIAIGEVRDAETAAIAIEAALTGHLVFSTLHAGSACGVIGRLLDMRVEPYLLTSGLRAVLNQRLVRRLCTSCRGSGCEACFGSGYRGRVLLAEFLRLNSALREAVLARADTALLESAVGVRGQRSIWHVADDAVARGVTDEKEIVRVLGPRR